MRPRYTAILLDLARVRTEGEVAVANLVCGVSEHRGVHLQIDSLLARGFVSPQRSYVPLFDIWNTLTL